MIKSRGINVATFTKTRGMQVSFMTKTTGIPSYIFHHPSSLLHQPSAFFIERNPVSTKIVGLWMKNDNLSIIPIPGMVPTATHIKI